MSAMSTPINQLNPGQNFNGQNAHALEEDPMVMGVIDEMEQEVSYKQQSQQQHAPPPSVTSTHVASFKQQVQHPRPIQNGHGMQHEEPLFAWNQEDAQTALLLAFVAFCVFYPCDTSAYYEKFDFTRNMKSYDIFVRLALLTVLVYFITRKLKT